VTEAPELNADIEEADLKTILYALYLMLFMPQNGSKRLVVLSLDSDVLILLLYYWSELKSLWIKAGVGIPQDMFQSMNGVFLSSFACCAYFDRM